MNRTRVGAVALLFFAATNAPAQACAHALVGRVIDQMGEPVRGALVMISGQNIHARADSTGRYRLCGLPVGPITVSAQSVGMTPHPAEVVVSADRDDTLDLRLTRPGLCRRAPTIDTAALAAAEERWRRSGLHSYAFVVTESYYGPGSQVPWLVIVRNDTVVDAREASMSSADDSIPFRDTHVHRDAGHFASLTPPQLFARIGRFVTDSLHTTSVQYDPALGYPTLLSESLNCAFDAGGTIRIEHLRPRVE